MALDGETLYVADTENHLIRKVDLAGKTGDHGRRHRRAEPRHAAVGRSARPLTTALSSPWDFWIHDGDLLIAMAGVHQIWVMRLDGSADRRLCGQRQSKTSSTGRLRPRRWFEPGFAAFAQPSGLASDGHLALRGRQRGQFHPRRPVRRKKGSANHRRHGPSSLGPAVHVRRRRRARPGRAAATSAGNYVLRRKALRGRHVQQQDQGDRPRHGRARRRWWEAQRRDRPTILRCSTSRRESPPPPESCTWPTRTIT